MANLPSKLYKYKSIKDESIFLTDYKNLQSNPHAGFSDYGLDAISKGTIWFAKPSSLNDPFDCQLKVNIDNQYFENLKLYLNALGVNAANVQNIIAIIGQCKSQGMDEIQTINHLEQVLKNNGQQTIYDQLVNFKTNTEQTILDMGILSLTPQNDNLLMWAHYAGAHTGYCLEFDTEDEHEGGNVFRNPLITRAVNYGDYYRSLIDLKPFDAQIPDLVDKLICYKSKEWAYENEWRCIQPIGDKLYPFPGKLTGVIFGARCSDLVQECVVKALQRLPYKVDIYNAIIRNNKFAVEIVKLAN